MAKNRNKKKRDGAVSMDTSEPTLCEAPQAMDTSESGAQGPAASIKIKKGKPMKRTKNVRKKKAIAKAISANEKSAAKVSRQESKSQRTQSAKSLYD